MGFPSRDLWY